MTKQAYQAHLFQKIMKGTEEQTISLRIDQHILTLKMTPVMKICLLQMIHLLRTVLKMWKDDASENKIINMKMRNSSLSLKSCLIIMKLRKPLAVQEQMKAEEMSMIAVNH